MKFITHKKASKPVTVFWRKTSLIHFFSKKDSGEQIIEADIKVRNPNFFVFIALGMITLSYFRHLISRPQGQRFFNFSVGSVDVGKYVTTSVQRAKPETITSSAAFVFHFHVGLFRAAFVLGAALRESKSCVGLSLGDIWYMDGVWLDYFLARPGTVVYFYTDPFGLISVKDEKYNLLSTVRSLENFLVGQGSATREEIDGYMADRMQDPASAIYYYSTNEERRDSISGIRNQKNFLIYTESFTDSQMQRGYDGFRNGYEWLIFTLRALLERNDSPRIFVKPHPVYFASSSPGSPEFTDRKIWNKILRLMDSQDVVFLDYSISNREFLSGFSSNESIVVSHHGNALVEAAWLGFSSISSGVSSWGNRYKFSHTWNSQKRYGQLLTNTDPKTLSEGQIQEVRNFISDFYMNEEYVDVRSHRVAKLRRSMFPAIEVNENPASLWPSTNLYSEEQITALAEEYAKKVWEFS